ncbi:MAG: hypothetical protein R3C60_12665 [Parvularculaceae bacterium]
MRSMTPAWRARPIIMTTLAMSAGMLPVAAQGPADGALRRAHGRRRYWRSALRPSSARCCLAAAIWVDRLERLTFGLMGLHPKHLERDKGATPAPAPAE